LAKKGCRSPLKKPEKEKKSLLRNTFEGPANVKKKKRELSNKGTSGEREPRRDQAVPYSEEERPTVFKQY